MQWLHQLFLWYNAVTNTIVTRRDFKSQKSSHNTTVHFLTRTANVLHPFSNASLPLRSCTLSDIHSFQAQRYSDENKTQDAWGQEDIAESPDSDVKEPQRSQPGRRNLRTLGRGSEFSGGWKTNPQPGAGPKPTRWRLQRGRNVWQMPFELAVKNGFMWTMYTYRSTTCNQSQQPCFKLHTATKSIFFNPPSSSAPTFLTANRKQKDGKDDVLSHMNQRHAKVLMPDQNVLL